MKKNIKNILIITGILAVILFLLYTAFIRVLPQITKIFNTQNNEAMIESFLTQEGHAGGLISLSLLQMFQVISIFFPGAPIQIAGGLVYGNLRSFMVCHLSFVFANTMVFITGRKGINPLAKLIHDDSPRVTKVTNWINSNDPAFMCMFAYMMPGVPNGFVPYAAMKTTLSIRHFCMSVYAGSFLSIFIMCTVGSAIMNGNYLISVIMMGSMYLLIFILYKNKNQIIDFIHKHWHSK